ncbi:hypothetical protein BDN71DRAFT_1510509 [Pleurotus eryngii]|uniref:Cytochrome P450 n=1 Tax=Pleurotus eryngii TaxID=5323 RepID=A0A9P5ZQJ0_PLEER|nr:hypothetical protein BDN71DRAFT_1510509 [Pleurotus eryngii]
MDVSYAIDIASREDPHIVTAEKALAGFNIAFLHGAFLVEVMPILKHVPAWMPGARFQKKAKEWKHYAEKCGTNEPSFTSRCLENVDDTGDVALQERLIQGTAANLYAAGFDTTTSALNSLILALLTHPFPRINSFPGLHDETKYPDPFAFKPERWLLPDGKLNPDMKGLTVAFGFVRRLVQSISVYLALPGRHLASTSIWITTAMILNVFKFNHDVDGNIIIPSGQYCPGLIPSPIPFKCQITLQSYAAKTLIQGVLSA